MKKKKIFIGLAILLAVSLLALIIAYVSWNNNIPDEPGTITLTQGTQTRYSDISIGLSNIEGDFASLSIYDDTTGATTTKQVKAGDMIEVYSYSIKVNSVKEVANPSILPGSSQGYVKLVINKK